MKNASLLMDERAGTMSESPTIFEFERDFAGSLRCIPMIARQKLDIVGIKMTLRQWSRVSREERGLLVDRPCDTNAEQEAYRALVLELIATRADEPVRFLVTQGLDDWREPDRMPEAVLLQAQQDGVQPPTPAQWAALAPLKRFALIKLARSKHENENFVPALEEFGILQGEG
ncbi:nitrate reductase associated protein [Acetobacter estunensis]|uniref:nitrate reductase associated protein n=1 Tax=Acetobacter estunensis TaxID=104097 RepID=UPI001C2D145F|nr:nitrate reductase associated protein [Acetobacter estunensis]MBV1838277.1 nitrate reductase associated protein [Acetobacter estunensis]